MANIFKNPTHKAHLSKNGFDMSMSRKFTAACGQLLPVYWDYLLPGDKVRFSAEMFSRTPQLLSPAFVKFTNHIDWFFVPINQLYQFFGNSQFGIDDNWTNLAPQNVNKRANPLMNLPDVYSVLFTWSPPTTGAPYVKDLFGVSKTDNARRLLQLLDYSNVFNTSGYDQTDCRLNTLLLQAYQKIYYDVYRLSDRESNLVGAYNFDNFYNTDVRGGSTTDTYSDGSSVTVPYTNLANLLSLHYRPWKKDLYTDLRVSPLINGGSISMQNDVNLGDVNNWLGTSNLTSGQTFGKPTINNNKDVSGNTVDSLSTGSPSYAGLAVALRNTVSTSNLRSMFAVEKLASITRRAAKHYDAQVLAHFGVNVPEGISSEVYRLGSDSKNFSIGDVVSTADTYDSSSSSGAGLGKMAGTAASYVNGDKKHFIAPCHGILMAIYSCVPEADYQATGVDRFNTYANREDYYQPEFDRLGEQPQFFYERNFANYLDSTGNTILGWQYRYAECKSKANKINNEFLKSLKHWTVYRQPSTSTSLSNFLIDPSYLNTILPVNFISQNNGVANDYLFNDFRFHVFKSSVMSTYGLPNL